jgi:hypothetical protein
MSGAVTSNADAPVPNVADGSGSAPQAEISNSPAAGFTYARVRIGHSVAASRRAGGRRYKRYSPHTEMGSRRNLAIVKVRGDWLGVAPTMKRNGKLAWIRRSSDDVKFVRTMYSVRVDLSKRLLQLRDGKRVVRSARVTIGRPGSPTPAGRFAVTDKLNGRALSSYYGCCLLALNGHQPQLPAGWQGGSRIAIHGTNVSSSIGSAASAGCVRADGRDLHVLMRLVPTGAPVFIRR